MDLQKELNLKQFNDYRSFLVEYLEMKKRANPNFSLGMWTKQLGLSSTSTLTRVLTGERSPGSSVRMKLSTYFKFTPSECEYFEDLIRLHKAKNVRLKVLMMEKMSHVYGDSHLTILDDRSHEVISHWFCLGLREMTRLRDFNPDPAWINKRLLYPVSEKEIAWALELLIHQGLLKANDRGRLIPAQGYLHTQNDIASQAVKTYHQQTLKLAHESLYATPLELREVTAGIITLSGSKIAEAKSLIRDFKEKFSSTLNDSMGSQTYQFQIQFFPITKDITE